jgi:hypothetical protein
VAGVEVRRDNFGRKDADAWWEGAVESSVQVGVRDWGLDGEGGDLGEGVDAGVGSSGALREDALAYGAVDGVGEEALNGWQAGLNLPSIEGCAVVGESELPVRHALLCTVTRRELQVTGGSSLVESGPVSDVSFQRSIVRIWVSG